MSDSQTEETAPQGGKPLPLDRALAGLNEQLLAMRTRHEEEAQRLRESEGALADLRRAIEEVAASPQAQTPAAAPDPVPTSAARPPVRQGLEAAAQRELRLQMLRLSNALGELDRLVDAEQVEEMLYRVARGLRLRALLLQQKGKFLVAEAAWGFPNFDGEKASRLRKVSVALEADGIFAATAVEKQLYSGPRPGRGFPVDLVLVMGKRRPSWCLIVPLPYRNRWGRFLYIDCEAEQLSSILMLEALARTAVQQMKASRSQRHEPSEKLRVFRDEAVEERRKKNATRSVSPVAGVKSPSEPEAEEAAPTPGSLEELMLRKGRKKSARYDFLANPPEADRFNERGELIHVLEAAEIRKRLGNFPAIPVVAGKVLRLLEDPDCSAQQLHELIASDQGLSLRLMQVANSSLYASMGECETVGDAVIRLGFTTIRSWLLATATRSAFVEGKESEDVHRLYQQSVLTAIACKNLARATKLWNPESAFMAGIVQNMGLMHLACAHPKTFSAISRLAESESLAWHDAERKLLSFDHADAASALLQDWGLAPDQLVALGCHHRKTGDSPILADLIALGEEIALRSDRGHLADWGTEAVLEAGALARLDLGDAELIETVAAVENAASDSSLMI